MFNFSIWKLDTIKCIEDVQEKIKVRPMYKREVQWDDDPLTLEFKESSMLGNYENIETITIDNKKIRYIVFGSSIEMLKYVRDPNKWYMKDNTTLKPREERTRYVNSDILAFENNNGIYVIFFSGVTNAKQIISGLFTNDMWGGVSRVKIGINEDILFWMFKTYIDSQSKQLSNTIPIYITAIRSYLGKTRDEINTLRGKGEKISALLGTLAFLFSNDRIKSIRPELQYNEEVFLVEISLSGTFKTDESEYDGKFSSLEKNQKISAIIIYLVTVILPNILKAYNENLENNEWSEALKINFIESLGTMIKDSVDKELENMKNYDVVKIDNFLEEIEVKEYENNEEIDVEIEQIDSEMEEIDSEI